MVVECPISRVELACALKAFEIATLSPDTGQALIASVHWENTLHQLGDKVSPETVAKFKQRAKLALDLALAA